MLNFHFVKVKRSGINTRRSSSLKSHQLNAETFKRIRKFNCRTLTIGTTVKNTFADNDSSAKISTACQNYRIS